MTIEDAVLQGRLDNFENFKTNYIAGINEMIAALERLANVQEEAETPMTSAEEAGVVAADLINEIFKNGVQGVASGVADSVGSLQDALNLIKQDPSLIQGGDLSTVISNLETAKKVSDWNSNIDKKIAEKQAEGKTVYVTVDDDGKKHYSTVSADKAKDLAGGASTVTTVKGSSSKSTSSKSTSSKKKASGSSSLYSTDLYHINELGDELLIPPTGNLAYLTKGTGIIPAHLTNNLMDLGQYNMAQWAKIIGNASGATNVDSHNVVIQNMTVKSDNADSFVRDLQNLAILRK